MKEAIAKKWVKALRSGKFKQGREMLTSVEPDGTRRHCCLGVLCEITPGADRDGTVWIFEGASRTQVLPPALVKAVGMGSDDGHCEDRVRIGKRKFNGLAAANDHGATFRGIANWIEKNWKTL